MRLFAIPEFDDRFEFLGDNCVSKYRESGSLLAHPFGDSLDEDPDSLGTFLLFPVVVLRDGERPVIQEEAHAGECD